MPTTPRVGPAQRARLAAGPPLTGPTADQHESARISTAQHGSARLSTAQRSSGRLTHTHTHILGGRHANSRSELAAYTHGGSPETAPGIWPENQRNQWRIVGAKPSRKRRVSTIGRRSDDVKGESCGFDEGGAVSFADATVPPRGVRSGSLNISTRVDKREQVSTILVNISVNEAVVFTSIFQLLVVLALLGRILDADWSENDVRIGWSSVYCTMGSH